MTRTIGKGRSVALILFLVLLALVCAGQTWFSVSMSPTGEAVVIQAFDGYTVFGWISPLIFVTALGALTATLVGEVARWIIFGVSFVSSLLLTVLSTIGIFSKDLSGVALQIEQATGIAATHGIDGLNANVESPAFFGLLAFGLLNLALLTALVQHRKWTTKPASPKGPSPRTPNSSSSDTISIWDQQRS